MTTAPMSTEVAAVPATPPLLTVDGLTVRFGGMRALDRVSFDLHAHERLGIIGANGAGKSTLLKAIAGDLRPASGTVRLAGTTLPPGATWRRARRGIVRTRQELGLFPTMTVAENIQVGADAVGKRGHHATNTSATRPTPEHLLDVLDIGRWRHHTVGALPYGIRKLTELARALAAQPLVLLLDEPVAGLNTNEKAAMVTRLTDALNVFQLTLILVEHDMETVANLCPDQALAMVAGQIAVRGTFAEVVASDIVVESYFGSKRRAT